MQPVISCSHAWWHRLQQYIKTHPDPTAEADEAVEHEVWPVKHVVVELANDHCFVENLYYNE